CRKNCNVFKPACRSKLRTRRWRQIKFLMLKTFLFIRPGRFKKRATSMYLMSKLTSLANTFCSFLRLNGRYQETYLSRGGYFGNFFAHTEDKSGGDRYFCAIFLSS